MHALTPGGGAAWPLLRQTCGWRGTEGNHRLSAAAPDPDKRRKGLTPPAPLGHRSNHNPFPPGTPWASTGNATDRKWAAT